MFLSQYHQRKKNIAEDLGFMRRRKKEVGIVGSRIKIRRPFFGRELWRG